MTIHDRKGAVVALGAELKRGGEGTIFAIAGRNGFVAKIYHRKPNKDKVQKLEKMVEAIDEDLRILTSWPIELLYDGSKAPRSVVGFVMRYFSECKEVFKLQTPKKRKLEFKNVDYRFIVAVAANTARAVAAVHKRNHVIGDVNNQSIMVSMAADDKGTVRIIDCDSFHLRFGSQVFPCAVGQPLYTAPELQGQDLVSVARTADQDNFSLAILVYELLSLGRHPFSGRYTGPGEPTPQDHIRAYRYAYSTGAAGNQMSPPPNTLMPNQISPEVEALFERAFARPTSVNSRPTATTWAKALADLQNGLARCKSNLSHYAWRNLRICPWCQLEQRLGFSLFGEELAREFTLGQALDLAQIKAGIRSVAIPEPLAYPPVEVVRPSEPSGAFVSQRFRSAVGTFIYAAVLGLLITLCFIEPGAICFVVFAGFILVSAWSNGFGYESKTLKLLAKQELELKTNRYGQALNDWNRHCSAEVLARSIREVNVAISSYEGLDQEYRRRLKDLERTVRERQLERYLDGYFIEKGVITGIGEVRIATLRSYGIETAADVSVHAVWNIPGFGEHLTSQLCAWRERLASRFRFDASKGVEKGDINALRAEIGKEEARLRSMLHDAPAALRERAIVVERERQARKGAMSQQMQELAAAKANHRIFRG